jgi:hypothetical protein
MRLCDACGFVLNESDFKCANCATPIPNREGPIEQIQARTPIEKTAPKIITPRNLSGYLPKKTIILLLVVGILLAPQTQSLMNESLDYWDEMNTPYYNIPESITINLIRNFTIYLENGKSAEYELILGKPENRPSWPQQDTNLWQEINQINVNPLP